jgi:hypothetical protein
MLPSMLVRALVSLPPMLLATALAADHAEHPSVADMVVQAALVVFLAALFINVVLSVVAIFGNEETSEPADGRLTSPPERNPSLAEPAATAPEAKVD